MAPGPILIRFKGVLMPFPGHRPGARFPAWARLRTARYCNLKDPADGRILDRIAPPNAVVITRPVGAHSETSFNVNLPTFGLSFINAFISDAAGSSAVSTRAPGE